MLRENIREVSIAPLPGLLDGGTGGLPEAIGLLSLATLGSHHVTLGRRRSLILWGPTRVGKTVWARSLGDHAYFCGLYSGAEALRAPATKYAIFDDIQGGIKFFPQFKNWLGCQAQFQIKVLYKDPVLIDWGKPTIWLSNSDPRVDLSPDDATWIEGNCDIIYIEHAIFHANT